MRDQRHANCQLLKGLFKSDINEFGKIYVDLLMGVSANDLSGTTLTPLVDDFIRWAEDHPSEWEKDMSYLAVRNDETGHFWVSYPCKN